jgi:hypothetical protein
MVYTFHASADVSISYMDAMFMTRIYSLQCIAEF